VHLRKRAVSVAKVAIAAFAVTALVSVPAKRIAPGLSYLELAALLFVGFVVLCCIAVAGLILSQWVLRKGGTDTQWFWFPGEPLGLRKLRREAEEKKRHES
jgi:hypothetical protein